MKTNRSDNEDLSVTNTRFKIGDRIKHIGYPNFGVGVIKGIEGGMYEIEFENKTSGCSTYPNCKEGYGYFMFDEHNFELVDTFTKVTNEQLGAVYLKIDGLDKERFKKLTEGMNWSYNYTEEEILKTLGFKYVENFCEHGYTRWVGSNRPEAEAQLITLDELEERLFPSFTLPEKWCIKITDENREMVKYYFDNLCPDRNYMYSLGVLYSNKPTADMDGIQTSGGYDLSDCTEITFEQFKKHVLKQDDNMTTQRNEVSKGEQGSTTFKVTRQALSEVLPHVCSVYKSKINKLAQEDLFSNEIEVPENVVRLAHKDATKKEHKEWLDKYLPLPKKKKIEVVEVKEDGFWTKATRENNTAFNDLKNWENIVLIKENFKDGLDLIMCYSQPSNPYACNHFLGYYNEGNLED